jgi:uncharacterized phage infection (PIP) family protein YhgE
MSIDELTDYMDDMNDTLNSIGDLTDIIDNLNDSINLINNSYNILLINFNYLYNNFTSYVSLLNSLSNVTLLISWINGNISSIQSDISDIESDISDIESDISTINSQISTLQANITSLDSRIDILESEKLSIPPLSVFYLNGWTSGSYNMQCMYALHSDNDARIDASFYVSITGYYKIMIIHASNTNSRNDDGIIYSGKMSSGSGGTVENLLTGANFDLNRASLNTIYQSTHSNSIYIENGKTVFCAWLKTEDETSGSFFVYGIVLKEV